MISKQIPCMEISTFDPVCFKNNSDFSLNLIGLNNGTAFNLLLQQSLVKALMSKRAC